MVQEDVRDGEGVRELPVADEGHGADDADALLPERLAAARELIEQGAVLVQQPFAQERVAGQVHQIPVVDALGMGEVEVDARLLGDARFFCSHPSSYCSHSGLDPESFCVFVYFYQREQRRQPHFVEFAPDARLQRREVQLLPAVLHDGARHGDLDPQKLVALAVLAGAGLEEARQAGHLRGVGVRHHLFEQGVHSFLASI